MGFLRLSFVVLLVVSLPRFTRGDDAPPAHKRHEAHAHTDSRIHDGHPGGASPNSDRLTGGTAIREPTAESLGRWPLVLLGIYSLLVVAASLLGGWLPQLVELSHNRMQVFISLIGGFMLGIGVLHMLPHALVELGEDGPDLAAYGMMTGLLLMFLLLRVFHFHHHGPTEVACAHNHDGEEPHHSGSGGHAHDRGHSQASPPPAAHHLSWLGVFAGMALHTLIDGLALGASVEADVLLGDSAWLLGSGTFLAVVLHKPLDSVAITSLMKASGWSVGSRHLASAAFALFCPLGAVLFVLGVREFAGQPAMVVGLALAVSAGVFVCIALSDLLPEMEFHSHNRLRLTCALLAGVALALGIGFFESDHSHSHRHTDMVHSQAE